MTARHGSATRSLEHQGHPSHGDIYRSFTSDFSTNGSDTRAQDSIEPFRTASEVAEVIGVTTDWVYEQARLWERTNSLRGLPSYKIAGARRFRWSEVDAALTGNRNAQVRRTGA